MPFVRQFHTLLQKSNQNIIIKNLDDSIEMQNFDTNFDLISTKKILDGKYSFVDVYFDINEDDTIYGIINVQKNSLIHLYINDKVIIETDFFHPINKMTKNLIENKIERYGHFIDKKLEISKL